MVPHKIIGTPVDSGIELKCRIEASPKPITVWSRKKGTYVLKYVAWNILMFEKFCKSFVKFTAKLLFLYFSWNVGS